MKQQKVQKKICERSYALALLLIILMRPASAGREFPLLANEAARSDELIVRFSHGAMPASVLQAVVPGASFYPISAEHDVYLVKVPHPAAHSTPVSDSALIEPTKSASASLAANSQVIYVEPNRLRVTQALAANDPQLAAQWALQQISAVPGWSTAPGQFMTGGQASANRIKIAILDSGADCTHADFINSGGTSPDSASGGQLSFALSKAYYETTISLPACDWQDDLGHGTHVAGIIGAAANNATGVAGLGFPVELVIYKVLFASGGQGIGADSVIAQAIIDAANSGVSVISMSLGGAGYSPTLQIAINYAWQKNILVVAAAGNGGTNSLWFPGGANYAVGVGASDNNDAWVGYSNYGPQVHIAAPGVNIISTLPGGTYGYLSGTSMATPYVAGLAGLLATASPNISAAAMAMRIEQSADNANAGGGADPYLGYGRINVSSALNGTLRPATQGGITGQVINSTNGLPVSGVTISVAGQLYTSDNTGLYRFYGISAGRYTITSGGAEYPTLNQQVVVVPGADTQFSIVMGGSPAEFTGTVSDLGTPVSGAVVQAISAGLIQGTAVTGADGAYCLYVQAGTYQLVASTLYSVTTMAGPETASSGSTTAVNLALPSEGRIQGSVTLSNGLPAANGAVSVSGTTAFTTVNLDQSGNFTTIGLPADVYTVTGVLPGLTTIVTTVGVPSDSTPVIALKFPDNGSNTILAVISAQAGPANARNWSITFKNQGSSVVAGLLIGSFTLTQQGGPVCQPAIMTPFPEGVGDISPGSVVVATVTINFSSCAAAARFLVTMPFTANSESMNGRLSAGNKFQ